MARWTVVALASIVLAVAPTPAGASVPPTARREPPATVHAGTDPTGAHVRLGTDGSYRDAGTVGATTGGGDGGCVRRWEPATGPALGPGVASYLGLLFGPAPSPAHRPFSVYCDADYLGAVWLLPSAFTLAPGTAPSAADLAARLARDLPYPRVTVGAAPAGRGLTGLESWFWIDGYDGAPIVDTVGGFGTLVQVEARADAAVWEFGDGSPSVTTAVGPERAVHVFETRSGVEGFPVGVGFRFAVRYRVNGGPWLDLPPVERTAARQYPVVESRAQLVPSGE